MGSRWIAVLGVLLLAAPALSQERDEPRSSALLICYPNAPGSSRQAQPVMDQLGQYLSRELGDSVRPHYFNELPLATQWLQTHRPRFGILSLGMFLRWRDEHGLSVVALSERQGAVEQRFTLLVPSDSPLNSVEDLKAQGRPVHVWSSLLDDLRFASRVVFAGRVTLGPEAAVRVASTTQPLRALRRMKKGSLFEGKAVDAVLVDGATWSGLQKLKTFQGAFRVLYTSPLLPTPPVVAFGGVEAERSEKLGSVLSQIGVKAGDDEGRRLLKTLQVTGFRWATSEVMKQAIADYEGSK